MTDFILQLHITGNCNLRCRHCYIDEHCRDMSCADVRRVVGQYEALIKRLERRSGQPIRAHIHFTGGEPLLHPEIRRILRFFFRKRRHFVYGVMSNGTRLEPRTLALLRRLRLIAFQVSLDGDEAAHDAMRGRGNFQAVLGALDTLAAHGIPARVSFTAHKENYTLFPQVAATCRAHRVSSLWSDRYVPFGADNGLSPLTAEDMPAYAAVLQTERDNPQNAACGLTVQNHRALQLLCGGEHVYYCKAAESMITVDEHGNIMPCRRLPLVCGNVADTTLADVYDGHETFIRLRQHRVTGKCVHCAHAARCRGGERCFTHAVGGDDEAPDPCCPL